MGNASGTGTQDDPSPQAAASDGRSGSGDVAIGAAPSSGAAGNPAVSDSGTGGASGLPASGGASESFDGN